MIKICLEKKMKFEEKKLYKTIVVAHLATRGSVFKGIRREPKTIQRPTKNKIALLNHRTYVNLL